MQVNPSGFSLEEAKKILKLPQYNGFRINESRMQLADKAAALIFQASNLDPESPESQALMTKIAYIHQVDKMLELQKVQEDIRYKWFLEWSEQRDRIKKKALEQAEKAVENGSIGVFMKFL